MKDGISLREHLRPAVVLFVILSMVTGIVYPLLVTGIAQAAFPWQANGSLVTAAGQPITNRTDAAGSKLIGQAFSNQRYFWSRPSATGPFPYNAAASSGSNLGPTSPTLADALQTRAQALRMSDHILGSPIPVDLVTSSASGLDPHISPAAAMFQAQRVAIARGIPLTEVQDLIKRYTEGRLLSIFGEPRVNVLLLNIALDQKQQPAESEEISR